MYVKSHHAQDMQRTKLKNQVSSNNCFEVLLNEEPTSVLHLPVTQYLQTSLNIFLESEDLTETDLLL